MAEGLQANLDSSLAGSEQRQAQMLQFSQKMNESNAKGQVLQDSENKQNKQVTETIQTTTKQNMETIGNTAKNARDATQQK